VEREWSDTIRRVVADHITRRDVLLGGLDSSHIKL
jgi:hypothetical protein